MRDGVRVRVRGEGWGEGEGKSEGRVYTDRRPFGMDF